MKKNVPKPAREMIVRIAVPVLFVALCVLTILTIFTITWSNAGAEGTFDLDGLTNEARREDADVSGYLLPEFIGITTGGIRSGISVSHNIVSELYGILIPTICNALESSVPLSDNVWNDYTAAENSIYIKYHSELPDGIVSLFAGMTQKNSEPSVYFNTNIREIFILPIPSETTLVTRSDAGEVKKYVIPSHKAAVSVDELERFVRSYGSGMVPFLFNEGKYETLAWTEPVYTEALRTRNLIMTDGTAALIQNSSSERESLLRLFGFNPDKLLNVHEEEDGSSSYYDTEGILYLRDSSFEYVRSSEDSGMDVSDILGGMNSASGSVTDTLKDYVQAAVLLYESIAEINKNYTGGDADLMLRSASSLNGEVTLRFAYVLDNIRIADEQDAYTITFSSGAVQHVRLHTIAVRILAERTRSYTEWWFASKLNRITHNVQLVYRSDYLSESVSAEWAAEELGFTEPPAEAEAAEIEVPNAEKEGDHGE